MKSIPGMIVLDQDIFNRDPDTMMDTQVDMTIFDGRTVYER